MFDGMHGALGGGGDAMASAPLTLTLALALTLTLTLTHLKGFWHERRREEGQVVEGLLG